MEIKSGSFVEGSGISPYVASQLQGAAGMGAFVSPALSYWLWERSDVVGTAVDMIAKAFAQIRPSLRIKKTGEFLNFPDDHPVLSLFENTRSGQNPYQFKYQLMTSYAVTGACYPVTLGSVTREPAGIYTVPANMAQLQEGAHGWLGAITMSANFDQRKYNLEIMPRRPWTYQRASKDAETVQVIESTRSWGVYPMSPLEKIYWQIISKYYGHASNASMLKNGSRPGRMWSPPEGTSWSQDQREIIQAEVEKLSGPFATAANVVAPNTIKTDQLQLSPSDMDFANLINSCKEDVFNGYQIPLPLVLSKTMTLSNYDTSIGALYNMSVLPRAKAIYQIIGPWLLSRYRDGDKYELTVNSKNLDALKGIIIERQKAMAGIGTYSDNEVRQEGGDDGYGPEGDKIYKLATLVPVGEDDDLRE